MTSWTDSDTRTTYTFNPDNTRKSKTVNGVKTEQVWIGDEIVLDFCGDAVTSYIHGLKPIQSDYGWYTYNANGDVVALTDDEGRVTRDYEYDPYGVQLTEVEETDHNPYRYCGEYYDADSGLVYLRARYYDPEMGRFVSEDPHWNVHNMVYGDDGNGGVRPWKP